MAASGTGERDGIHAQPGAGASGTNLPAGAPLAAEAGAAASTRPDDDVFATRPRPRASPLRVVGIVIVSILATVVLFRAAVEAVRAFVAG